MKCELVKGQQNKSKRYVNASVNGKEMCPQHNVFEATDSTYLDGVFSGRPLKIRPLTPADGSYALAERETSCKR